MEVHPQNSSKNTIALIMDNKEKDIQKALGTLPEFTCQNCGKQFTVDEKFIYNNMGENIRNRELCEICATAQFVHDSIFSKTDAQWAKEKFDD